MLAKIDVAEYLVKNSRNEILNMARNNIKSVFVHEN